MSREKIKKNQETCNAVVKNEIQAQAREPPEEPARAEHLECIGCPYSAHGFVCWPGRLSQNTNGTNSEEGRENT